MKFFASAIATVSLVAASVHAAATPTDACKTGTKTLVGSVDLNGRPLNRYTCELNVPANGTSEARDEGTPFAKRQNRNLCGAPCTTYCNSGSGGPDPNDCSALASSLGTADFTIGVDGYELITYGSCEIYMNNYSGGDLVYCWGDFASVVDYIAFNCQGTTGDNGGSCHFYDETSISWIGVETA